MLRAARKLVIVAFAISVACAGTVSAGAGVSRRTVRLERSSVLETQILTQLNAIRAQHGLRPVRLSQRLAVAATQHSVQMARVGYFAHESANGSSFWSRISRFYRSGGYRYWAVGENLLWSAPGVDAAGALQMWMSSADHRRNILTRQWRQIGLGAVHVVRAPGVYSGREVTIVTTDFGVRR